jgi:hypothetical protein
VTTNHIIDVVGAKLRMEHCSVGDILEYQSIDMGALAIEFGVCGKGYVVAGTVLLPSERAGTDGPLVS